VKRLALVAALAVVGCSHKGYPCESRVVGMESYYHPSWVQMMPMTVGKTTTYYPLIHPAYRTYEVTFVRAETLTIDVDEQTFRRLERGAIAYTERTAK